MYTVMLIGLASPASNFICWHDGQFPSDNDKNSSDLSDFNQETHKFFVTSRRHFEAKSSGWSQAYQGVFRVPIARILVKTLLCMKEVNVQMPNVRHDEINPKIDDFSVF